MAKTKQNGATVEPGRGVVCEMWVPGQTAHMVGIDIRDNESDISTLMDLLAHWPREKIACAALAAAALLGMSDAERARLAAREENMADWERTHPPKSHPDRDKHTRTLTIRDAA